jgi:hypothetical protein
VWEFTLAFAFKNVENHFTWAFVGVYCPNSIMDKTLLWDELAAMLNWWNLP